MDVATIDFETRSLIDLRKVGASRYARDESTIILCLAYHLPKDSPKDIKLWLPENPLPEDLFTHIRNGGLVEAHNVGFERLIWHHVCCKGMSWPDVPFTQWRCSLSACSKLSLPRSLADAGKALGLPIQKDLEGNRIMLRLCKPKKPSKKDPSIWDDSPSKHARLHVYCKRDVESEIAISSSIPPLEGSELKTWQLDQTINLRGIHIDVEGAGAARDIIKSAQQMLDSKLADLTKGEVTSARRTAQLLKWLHKRGSDIPDLRAKTVEKYLESEGGKDILEALEIRRSSSKSSTAKLDSMLSRVDEDSRVRGNLVYHGASTGRWAGTGIQIQNFPRGNLSQEQIEIAIELFRSRDTRLLEMIMGDPLSAVSSCLRSFISAAPGSRLMVCDFASIEARVLAWVAGQNDLVAEFHAGKDVYISMASKIYDKPETDIDKGERFYGKSAVLGCGYGMGFRGFRDFCRLYGADTTYKEAKQVIKTYRDSNESIRQLWSEVGAAAIRAVKTKIPIFYRELKFFYDGFTLAIHLPSGRSIHYPRPKVEKVRAPWSIGFQGWIEAGPEQEEFLESINCNLGEYKDGRFKCSMSKDLRPKLEGFKFAIVEKEPKTIEVLSYMGTNSYTRKWEPIRTYGAKLVENIIQGVARDFLAEAMIRLEERGYPIIATVHDEVIAEVPEGHGSLEEFERLMCEVPKWGSGCPIAVEGYESERYKK